MNRSFVLLALVFVSANMKAQNFTKFYDSKGQETTAEKATFTTELTKESDGYKCITYWTKTQKVRAITFVTDTSMKTRIGLQKTYHKNGALEDSTFFAGEDKVKEAFHYYPNKQLECHYFGSENGEGVVAEAFDEEGKKIKNYIYSREAEPKGGIKGWQNYLKKAGPKELYSKDATKKMANVQVRFLLDETGTITKAEVIESSGDKTVDAEAVRMITDAPAWSPGIYKNKPVKSYHTQPLVIELLPMKKKE